jgi:hypothetical protein
MPASDWMETGFRPVTTSCPIVRSYDSATRWLVIGADVRWLHKEPSSETGSRASRLTTGWSWPYRLSEVELFLTVYLKEVYEERREHKECIDRELYNTFRISLKLVTLSQLEKLSVKYIVLCRDICQILYRRGIWIDFAKSIY